MDSSRGLRAGLLNNKHRRYGSSRRRVYGWKGGDDEQDEGRKRLWVVVVAAMVAGFGLAAGRAAGAVTVTFSNSVLLVFGDAFMTVVWPLESSASYSQQSSCVEALRSVDVGGDEFVPAEGAQVVEALGAAVGPGLPERDDVTGRIA
jgi:hypothetical protein